ncbi:hypothetical protein [Streptomyces incanus]|uniref:Uncharacterized protein n=1 Tax=Streptomyces incanus TaxID=887453 RepID=A0ABW0XHN0_9ACTN
MSVVEFRDRPANAHGAVVEAEVTAVQTDQLSPAQPEEAGHEHERPVTRLDRVGDVTDLLHGRGRPFRDVHDAGALDGASNKPSDGRTVERALPFTSQLS